MKGWRVKILEFGSRNRYVEGSLMYFGTLFYHAFSITRLYSVDGRVTAEWWWWIGEDKHPCLKQDLNSQLSVQAIKAKPQDQAATGTGQHDVGIERTGIIVVHILENIWKNWIESP
jgi:hypothetical protein